MRKRRRVVLLLAVAAGALSIAGVPRHGRLLAPRDVQETSDPSGRSPREGENVTVEGVVVATSPQGDFYYLGDPAGGPWSGLKVMGRALERRVGEAVSVSGGVREEFGETRLVERVAHRDGTAPVPPPTVITSADVASAGETWEGVVVRVQQVTVETEASGFGEWKFTDATGIRCEVDDEFFYAYMPDPGDTFDSLTGLVAYGFGDFHLEPRHDADFAGWTSVRAFDGRLSVQVVDEQSRPLPSKLTLFPIGGPSLSLGPDDRAEGSEDVAYLALGAGEVRLPSGTYDVVISRGPEYGLHQERVIVPSGGIASVNAMLVPEVDTSGWISGDFHLHCAPSSDTPLPVPGRIVSLAGEGVEWAIATDHNMVTNYAPVIADLGLSEWIRSTIGDEITTRTPSFGHFNAFPLPWGWTPPPFSGMDPEGLFAGARQSPEDEVVQVNHPSIPAWGDQYFDVYQLDPHTAEPRVPGFSWNFDAIEVFNGQFLDQGLSTLETFMRMLNAGRFFTATGNSDSHHLVFSEPGYPRNYVRVSDDAPSRVSQDELVRAVRAGETFVSYGPFLTFDVNGGGPGSLVPTVEGDVVMHARVQCASWLSVDEGRLYANGKVLQTFALAPPRGAPQDEALDFTDRPEVDTWYLLVVEGEGDLSPVRRGSTFRPLAFTNPVRVDADGDGLFTPPGNVADLVDVAAIDAVDPSFVPVHLGEWLAVRGCALTDSPFLDPSSGTFYVDDGTGGVQVRESVGAPTEVARGDRVWVGGSVGQILGETVLVDATVTIESGDGECAAPHDITSGELGSSAIEPWEGRVVRLTGVHVTSGTWPAGGTEGAVTLDDGSGPALLVVPQGVVVPAEAASLDDFTFTALAAQHDFAPPYDGGYHLLLRSASDLPLDGATLARGASAESRFGRPYPNPFRKVLSIPYVAAPGARLSVAVHDVRGARVRRLVAPSARDGRMLWDGTDDSGRVVAAGVYWLRFDEPGRPRAVKVVKLD